MKHQRIKGDDAEQIATKIAAKALEGEAKNLAAAVTHTVDRVIEAMQPTDPAVVSWLESEESLGFVKAQRGSGFCGGFHRKGSDGAYVYLRLNGSVEGWIPHGALSARNYNILKGANDRMTAFAAKTNNLVKELHGQIMALSTTKRLLEAWPEVKPIVEEVIGAGPAVDIPLEKLLGRYVPLLAAPEITDVVE